MKSLVIFDLDGTLADSRSPIDAEMSRLMERLLSLVKVAVISGGDWQQLETQVLARLNKDELLRNLSLLPTCGTRFYKYDSHWELLYTQDFTAEDKAKIVDSLQWAVARTVGKPGRTWGEVIEDRGGQITFSALGQQAPLDEKIKWDPDFAKRTKIAGVLETLIPEFSVRLGGATSIDVTPYGTDKGFGIRKLSDMLRIGIHDMIFVGDALFPGGNDAPAREAGALSIQVRDPHETKRVIESIVACLE